MTRSQLILLPALLMLASCSSKPSAGDRDYHSRIGNYRSLSEICISHKMEAEGYVRRGEYAKAEKAMQEVLKLQKHMLFVLGSRPPKTSAENRAHWQKARQSMVGAAAGSEKMITALGLAARGQVSVFYVGFSQVKVISRGADQQKAVAELAKPGSARPYYLVQALVSTDPRVRQIVSGALLKIGKPAVSELERAAKSSDPGLKAAATEVLEEIKK